MEASCHPRNRPRTLDREADGRRKTGEVRVPPTWWFLGLEAAKAMETEVDHWKDLGDYCALSLTRSNVFWTGRGAGSGHEASR